MTLDDFELQARILSEPVKTVGRITYIVLVQTLNRPQSINQSLGIA